MFDAKEIAHRLDLVKETISRVGRNLSEVTVIAVTKGFGPEAIQSAVEAGFDDVGENYAQELQKKYEALKQLQVEMPSRWHFIGHLQRNKVKLLAPYVDIWQSVDSTSLVDEIAKHAPSAKILIEVNLAGIEGRSGCMWSELDGLIEYVKLKNLELLGLMGIGPMGEAEDAREGFRRLAQAKQQYQLSELSIGMSSDYQVALEEGATMLRIGSAFFGSRPPIKR